MTNSLEKIILETNAETYRNDICDVVRLFFPATEVYVYHEQKINDDEVINFCKITEGEKITTFSRTDKKPVCENSLEEKKLYRRYIKLCVYSALSKHTKVEMPWGSLTGVRPTRVAYDLLDSGVDITILKETIMRDFFVSEKKAKLVYEIIKNQNCIIKNDHLIDLYINIPFCPSKCNYCSFISATVDSVKNQLPNYVDTLIKEIQATKKLIFDKALVVRTIYIGGGTPTVLSVEDLEKILSELSYPVNEFTVECGRADTITEEKLLLLKKYGVTRICINPQTFNEKLLKKIERNHTIKDVIEAYKLALKHNFVVNMDFIAGFEGESFVSFKNTIDTALELSPHNITLHTLALKKKADNATEFESLKNSKNVQKMLDYAYEKLTQNGYKPYYMYRQKNQMEGLENVGYTIPGYVCLFNVDSMEETASILACGANAITKRVYGYGGKIERFANVKNIHEYVSKIDELISKKISLFS